MSGTHHVNDIFNRHFTPKLLNIGDVSLHFFLEFRIAKLIYCDFQKAETSNIMLCICKQSFGASGQDLIKVEFVLASYVSRKHRKGMKYMIEGDDFFFKELQNFVDEA